MAAVRVARRRAGNNGLAQRIPRHAPIVRQLDWCAKAHVGRVVFTHCGSPIVRATSRAMDALVGQLSREYGLDVRIARDGDNLSLRPAVARD